MLYYSAGLDIAQWITNTDTDGDEATDHVLLLKIVRSLTFRLKAEATPDDRSVR